METLFVLEDQHKNSLKDFPMSIDYELAYLTTDGQSVSALKGTSDKGSVMFDPNALPAIPANFKCSQLTTDVQCPFFRVNQNTIEINKQVVGNEKIFAKKKNISAQERAMRVKSKVESKNKALQNRFTVAEAIGGK